MQDFESYSTIMNAGIDMFMLAGYNGNQAIPQLIQNAKIALLQNHTVDMTRLDDAVTRIIAVKMAMGLI
jgi:beta-glucosidase-like glycosyl hydrolase